MEPGTIVNRIDILPDPDAEHRILLHLNGEPNSGIREVKIISRIREQTVVEVNGHRVLVATSVYRDGVQVAIDWAGRYLI